MSTATKILAVLLAIALAGDVLLGRAYLRQRDAATVAEVKEDHAEAVALDCSKGTESLETAAARQEAVAATKRAGAAERALKLEREARQIEARPPAVPGNACASAQAELDNWWAGRARP